MARPEARPPPRPGCGLSRVRVRPRTRRRLGGVNARAARPPARTSLPRARGPGRLVPAPFPWWPPHPDPHRDAPSGRERCLELSRAAQRPACLSHSNRTFYSVASMGLGSSHPGATSRNGEPALRQDTAAAARTQRRRGAGDASSCCGAAAHLQSHEAAPRPSHRVLCGLVCAPASLFRARTVLWARRASWSGPRAHRSPRMAGTSSEARRLGVARAAGCGSLLSTRECQRYELCTWQKLMQHLIPQLQSRFVWGGEDSH